MTAKTSKTPQKRIERDERPADDVDLLANDAEDAGAAPAAEPDDDRLRGNVSPVDDLPVVPVAPRGGFLDGPNRVVVGDDLITEHPDGEKIGRTPGERPQYDGPVAQYHYEQVIRPTGGEVDPGPDTAAITGCLAAGYRPVGEAVVDGVLDHPDGVSKRVIWRVPCVRADRLTG